MVSSALTRRGRRTVKREAPRAVARLGERIEDDFGSLRETLSRLHPMAVLTRVAHTNLAVVAGEYFEPTFLGSESKVEILAGLLMTHPDLAETSKMPPLPSEVQPVFEALDRVDAHARLRTIAANLGDDRDADIRVLSQLRWLSLRGESYVKHAAELAAEVLDPISDKMKRDLGFTHREVQDLANIVEELTESKLNRLRGSSNRNAKEFLAEVRRGEVANEAVLKVFEQEGASGVLARDALARFTFFLTGALSVTPDEVVAHAPHLADSIDSMLAVLCCELGTLPVTEYGSVFDMNPLTMTPFVAWNGRFMAPVPGILMRDYLGVLEPVLRARVRAYDRRRPKALEEIALGLITTALPGSDTYSNLYYWVEEAGEAKRVELDGLVIFDRFAVVVEAKTSGISVPALRGDIERLKRDLQRSMGKAAQQAARAVGALESGTTVNFEDKRGNAVVSVDTAQLDDVFAIAPTLTELGGFSVEPLRTETLGLLQGIEPPWSVFVNDLRIVVDVCQSPAEFLLYIRWRSRLPLGTRVIALDEIDVFGAYLLCESAFSRLDTDPEYRINLANYTADFDDYYMWRPEAGKRPKKPQKFSIPIVRDYVSSLSATRPPGWLEAAGAALDLTLEELAAVKAIAKRSLAELGPSDVRPLQVESLAVVGVGGEIEWRDALDDLEFESATRAVFLKRMKRKPRLVGVISLHTPSPKRRRWRITHRLGKRRRRR
ncbi:MAG: hypothetical protein V3U63_11975 [Gemmatimonadota bacterium]